VVAQTRGIHTESLQYLAQLELKENVMSITEASTATEQQIEISEQQNLEQQK
jgi:hypothetical protein